MTLVDEMSVTWTFRGDPGLGLGMALATTMSDKSPEINKTEKTLNVSVQKNKTRRIET